MGIEEALKALREGKWVRRKVWHPDYAIKLCNVEPDMTWNDRYPVYCMSTLEYFYHFMSTSAPFVGEDLHVSNRDHEGMQWDLFCNDWIIADKDFCEGIYARSLIEKEEFRKKAHEESCRFWGDGRGRDYGIIEQDNGRWC